MPRRPDLLKSTPASAPASARAERFVLPALLLVALVARLLAWGYQKTVSVDGTTYIRLARALFGGPHFDTVMPPGYSALIGLAHRLGVTDEVRAAQVVSLLCGTLLIIPFHRLARRTLRHDGAAALVTLLLALTPLAIRYAVTTLSEATYLFLVLTAAACAVERRPGLAGLVGGAAAWVRPEAFLFTGALAVEAFLRERGAATRSGPDAASAGTQPGPSTRRGGAALAIALGLLVTGIGPTLLYNHAISGRWTLSRKVVNIAPSDFRAREVTVEQTLSGPDSTATLDRLARHGRDITHYYPHALAEEIRQLGAAAGVPALLLLVVGAATAPAALLPGLAQGFVVPAFPAVAMSPRMALPLLPFALLLAALGVGRLARAWPRVGVRGLGALALAGWLVAVGVAMPGLRINEDGNYPELRDAGLALRSLAHPGTLIFDRKPYTAFYAGGRLQTIPTGDYGAVIDAMLQVGGDYLVVAQSVAHVFRPELLPLVEDGFTMVNDPRLELVYLDQRYDRRRVAVYRFVREGEPVPTAEERAAARRLVAGIPEDPAQSGLHADLLRRQGDYEGMCRACETLLTREPENWRAMLNLSLGLITLDRDLARALRLAREAHRLAPDRPEVAAAVGWADSLCRARGLAGGDGRS